MAATHSVTNQVPDIVDFDTADHPAMLEAVVREGAEWAVDELHDLGRIAGSAEARDWARRAERNAPRLLTHDRYGNHVDQVEYDPSYHQLMQVAVSHGLHSGCHAGTHTSVPFQARWPAR